jgi:hypothetical protein
MPFGPGRGPNCDIAAWLENYLVQLHAALGNSPVVVVVAGVGVGRGGPVE